MHIPDGLPVDEDGARTVRAAEAIMAAVPGTTFLETLHQVEMAQREAGRRTTRSGAIAFRLVATDAQTLRTSFGSTGKRDHPAATRSDVYHVAGGIAEPIRGSR